MGVFFPLLLVAFIFGIVTIPAAASSPTRVHLSKTVATSTGPITNNPTAGAKLNTGGQWAFETSPVNILAPSTVTVNTTIPPSDMSTALAANLNGQSHEFIETLAVNMTFDVGKVCSLPGKFNVTLNSTGSYNLSFPMYCDVTQPFYNVQVWVIGGYPPQTIS